MPKIIFTSCYLRDAPPAQLENYVRYISTREGVEKIDESKLNLPATKNQKELIRAMLCRHMKISSENLRWYAAFHNEGHHPHVHLMVYSAKDHDGYLTEKSIEAMRSELAHDIFRQDFANIYEQQNQARAELKTGAANTMRELMDALRSGTMEKGLWLSEAGCKKSH